jgi:hypothetical protein
MSRSVYAADKPPEIPASGDVSSPNHLQSVCPSLAGVEAGEANIDGFSLRRSARRIRVPDLTASLMS